MEIDDLLVYIPTEYMVDQKTEKCLRTMYNVNVLFIKFFPRIENLYV